MRLVPPAAARRERMEQFRRDRATAPVLRATFPTVEQLRIELKFEAPSSNAPTAQSHVLYPPARAYFEYPCPYRDCDGHFDLGSAVRAALCDAKHRAEGVLECRIASRNFVTGCLTSDVTGGVLALFGSYCSCSNVRTPRSLPPKVAEGRRGDIAPVTIGLPRHLGSFPCRRRLAA